MIEQEPDGLHPTVAEIIRDGGRRSGIDVFTAIHRLAELRAAAAPLWREVDALLLPTTPLHPTHDEVAADPVEVNERLGRFTNFAKLMDLAALALPGTPRRDGLPFGVTLLAPAFGDRRLLELGAAWMGERAPVPPGIAGARTRSSTGTAGLSDRRGERPSRGDGERELWDCSVAGIDERPPAASALGLRSAPGSVKMPA